MEKGWGALPARGAAPPSDAAVEAASLPSPAPRFNWCEGAVRFQFSLSYVTFCNEVAGM